MSVKVSSAVFRTVVAPCVAPTGSPRGTVIFFHGSGHSGIGIKSWVEALLGRPFCEGKVRTLYPTAPMRPYTPADGCQQAVWFDRKRIAYEVDEDLPSIEYMCDQAGQLVEEAVEAGATARSIMLGGFSMGGALAMYMAFRRFPNVAGAFALSSFLNERSCVYESLRSRKADCVGSPATLPKLFMAHSADDTVVPADWGESTAQELRGHGVNVELHRLHGLDHELDRAQLLALESFVLAALPPRQS